MATLRVEKIVELPEAYEIEVYVSYLQDGNRMRVTVPKPISKAKVRQALQGALANCPSSGHQGLTAYWEGFEVEL